MYGTYAESEFEKSYANLVDMKELPDSTTDRSVIRLLRNKNDGICPFDDRGDHAFIKRFMENYFIELRDSKASKKMDLDKTE